MEIEKAIATDHEILTEITKQSKAYWGYPEEQLVLWSDLLTITKDYIESNQVYKLIIECEIVGYYAFIIDRDDVVMLDNLFVLPQHISKGFGKLLMDDFLNRMRNSGVKRITLESDPNAEEFYAKFGFIKTGDVATSTENRFLPVMELVLT